MPKYLVDVVRIGYSCRVIEVEAEDHHVAVDRALAKAPDLDFSNETDSDYEWQSVTLVNEKDGDSNGEV